MSGSLLGQTYDSAQVVTLSDTVDDPRGLFAALLVVGAGTLQVVLRDGTTVLFDSVNGGQILPLTVKRIMATNTTARVLGLRGAPYYGTRT